MHLFFGILSELKKRIMLYSSINIGKYTDTDKNGEIILGFR